MQIRKSKTRLKFHRPIAIVFAFAGLWAGIYTTALAQISEYPTLERVLFVEHCANEQPQRPRQEMLYKCVCVFDQLAVVIPFDKFTALETASNALSIKGERGRLIRSSEARDQAARFRKYLGEARNACLLPEQHAASQ